MRRPRARAAAALAVLMLALASCVTVTTPAPSVEPTAEPTPETSPSPSEELPPTADELAHSVVQVQMIVNDEPASWGSGTVISEDGLVLTNAHVATPQDFELDELIVAVTDSSDAPPVPTYRAEVRASDVVLDLAIIQMTEDLDGTAYEDGAVTPIPLGDSDEVSIGEDLLIFGYPAIGGETITFTSGLVSGFTADQILGDRAWIKTDATIAGGNSGGMAANALGELIGVPTQASAGTDLDPVDCRPMRDTDRDGDIDADDDCVPIGGFLNGVRPVNLAADMVDAVESGVAYEPIGGEAPSDFDVTQVRFETPVMTDSEPTGRPDQDLVWLGSGTTELCAWWEYSGMADGVRWDGIWALDGVIQEDVSFLNEVWSGGESGEWWVCVVSETAIDDGTWDLTLSVEGELIIGGFVGIGDALRPAEFTFVNASAQEVCYLFISPDVSTFWGGDWLGPTETIAPGASVSFNLPPIAYDIRGDDCNQDTLFEDSFTVSGPFTYTHQ